MMRKRTKKTFADIRPHDLITIQVPGGLSRHGREYHKVSGRVVMKGPAGWVINIGGSHGTPKVASIDNFIGFGDLT